MLSWGFRDRWLPLYYDPHLHCCCCCPGVRFLETTLVARTGFFLSVRLQHYRGIYRSIYNVDKTLLKIQLEMKLDDHGQRNRLRRFDFPPHPDARLLQRRLENDVRHGRSES